MQRALAYIALISVCCCTSPAILAQSDSTQQTESSSPPVRTKDPKKAAFLAAVLPGAGQIYNQKYWKVPIVYAAFATAIYFYAENRKWYLEYRNAYLNDLNDDEPGYEPSKYALQNIQPSQLRAAADENRRYMELSILGIAAVHGLQIIDATVDAHLFSFDVSEDLSMQWSPMVVPLAYQRPLSGIRMNITF